MENINWVQVLDRQIPLNVMLNSLPTKGNLVYEYNPFRNYRLTDTKYWYKETYYSLEELEKEGVTLSENKQSWLGVPNSTTDPVLYEKGQLVDFITDELNLSIDNPVHIIPQYSYDGSVNLIINDGINIPRLINSRFSATGRNTYEIVDRKGSNDTNIYDQGEQFNIDTSLYKIVDNIPKITFLGTSSGGNLRVGNYHFYFKLADADGNETDFIAESGLVSVFIGEGSYGSVHTGTKNENSTKQVEFSITNIDAAYDYIIIYFSRSTSESGENEVTEYIKINKKYNKTNTKIIITGFEDFEQITVQDINLHYNLVDAVQTSAVCQNMLFMGNVRKQNIPYEELQDLSLRILPFLGYEDYDPDIDQNYISGNPKKSYIDSKFIYNKTGYWPNELYRFGIVYIMPNGQLSPVFNVRGGIGIGKSDYGFSDIPINKDGVRYQIKYNESTNLLADDNIINHIQENQNQLYTTNNVLPYENVKGVCSFTPILQQKTTPDIYYIKFYIPNDVRNELKKHIKGYFFVRQPRIPLVLAQGLTLGIDKESRTPTIPTAGGILQRLQNTLSSTHVETENINGLNYITEGFLKRYSFTFKKKSSSLWGKIGKIMGVAALVVGGIAASLVTGGSSLLGSIALVGTITGTVGTTVGAVAIGLVAAAATGVAAATITGVIASTQELGQAVARIGEKKQLNGKATKAPSGYEIVEAEDSRILSKNFEDRIIIKDSSKNQVQCILCPDYSLNQSYYNQIFTGNEHLIETDFRQSLTVEAFSRESYLTNENRHFFIDQYTNVTSKNYTRSKIVGVPDNVTCVGIDNILYRSRAGEAEEAWQYECIGEDIVSTTSKDSYQKINTDIVRGSFSSYLAVNNNIIGPAKIVNIYIPGYDSTNLDEYINIRMNDNSVYNAITDRININNYETQLVGDIRTTQYFENAYRGDCYICQYTQRINRNFNDPSAPYNDEIVDINTWKDNYDPNNTEKYSLINSGDVNAVPLGMWVTFQLRSSNNLNIRTLDYSDVDETAMSGHPNGYYPVQPMSVEGVYKKADSQIYNKGFKRSLSSRWNFELPDVPHIKNWFGTRIMYSDIHINDGYKNGFRIFQGTHYRDYTREYGEIVKLVPFESSLLCVFEHGIALIPINERAIAGEGAGGNVYINTSNVLPENPKIISDMFGSQWPESVLKIPGRTGDSPQYVYGVDTVAKKIWRTDGSTLTCISDFRVQEFLNNNITLGERELTPKIGIRNVKTHYNAFKCDVMFTFYDNTYGFEEKVWNLCWNELLQKFITFYSWVPSYMENINNIPFSFNRDTSKWIAKLGTSHTGSSFADGVTLTNVILEDSFRENKEAVSNMIIPVQYLTKNGEYKTLYVNAGGHISYLNSEGTWTKSQNGVPKFIAGLSLSNRVLPDSSVHYRVDFSLERDSWNNYKLFKIVQIRDFTYSDSQGKVYSVIGDLSLPEDAMFAKAAVPLYVLCFNDGDDEWQEVYYMDGEEFQFALDAGNNNVYTYKVLYSPEALYSELYYRNSAGNAYADYDTHKLGTTTLANTYVPMDLGKTFNDDDIRKIMIATGMSQGEASKYKGESKSWIKDVDTLTLFEQLYGPDTIIGNTSTKYNKDNLPEIVYPCTTIGQIRSSMQYYGDEPMVHGIYLSQHWIVGEIITDSDRKVWYDLPIFKDITGKRPMLPREEQINPDKIVTLLNIKATISIENIDNKNVTLSDTYYNMKASYTAGTSLVNAGQYESVVAITPKWNLQFLSTDFWKHGQAGLIDIADDIYPTYWYGKQHPFEFECVVVNDPSTHKIFQNLELVANKAKPESFHYEIIGECYDFAKDKVNMYFRQEAMKALWQYNGADITYDRNFLKVQPRQQAKSADFPHKYYTRQDTINDVEDYYINITYPTGYDYRHLSGAEIVYYPTRQEYRIWNHAKAIDIDDLSQDDSRSIISANCQYLEDRWKIAINPILVCYKNEYQRKFSSSLISAQNSTWTNSSGGEQLPNLPIYNSPIPDKILAKGEIEFPDTTLGIGKDNALYNLYADPFEAIDTTNWLNDVGIYKTNFGEAQNRKELDMKDKFIKIRIRYSGEELAVIDFLNTVYRISYA